MGIIKFPQNEPLSEEITCVLCERKISPLDATLGPLGADGKPSMLCNGHLWDDLKFIDMLADYLAEERRKFTHANSYVLKQFGA
jgi:hypothetical protein